MYLLLLMIAAWAGIAAALPFQHRWPKLKYGEVKTMSVATLVKHVFSDGYMDLTEVCQDYYKTWWPTWQEQRRSMNRPAFEKIKPIIARLPPPKYYKEAPVQSIATRLGHGSPMRSYDWRLPLDTPDCSGACEDKRTTFELWVEWKANMLAVPPIRDKLWFRLRCPEGFLASIEPAQDNRESLNRDMEDALNAMLKAVDPSYEGEFSFPSTYPFTRIVGQELNECHCRPAAQVREVIARVEQAKRAAEQMKKAAEQMKARKRQKKSKIPETGESSMEIDNEMQCYDASFELEEDHINFTGPSDHHFRHGSDLDQAVNYWDQAYPEPSLQRRLEPSAESVRLALTLVDSFLAANLKD